MQCTKTVFVVEIVSCFLDVFFKSPKFTSLSHGPQTIALFRSNYKRERVRIRAICEGRKEMRPILREGRGNVRHKTSEKVTQKGQNSQLLF